MKTIFQSQRHPEVIIKVDLTDVNIKAKLFAWFNFKHNKLFNELCMWEGGEVDITEWGDIRLSGDNGILDLEPIRVDDLSELKLNNLVTNLI